MTTKSVPASTSNSPAVRGDIPLLLHTVFTAQTSQASLDAAYSLTDEIIRETGYHGLEAYGVLDQIRQAATDKKSGTRRESAMILLGALFERLPRRHPVTEVIFLRASGCIALALDALADKGAVVRESAQYALDALFANLRSEALVVGLLPVIMGYLEGKSVKWQGAVAAFELMARMAEKAKVGMDSKEVEKDKEILRESMGKRLAGLIPVVENGMHDLKAEVSTHP